MREYFGVNSFGDGNLHSHIYIGAESGCGAESDVTNDDGSWYTRTGDGSSYFAIGATDLPVLLEILRAQNLR